VGQIAPGTVQLVLTRFYDNNHLEQLLVRRFANHHLGCVGAGQGRMSPRPTPSRWNSQSTFLFASHLRFPIATRPPTPNPRLAHPDELEFGRASDSRCAGMKARL